jgi:uncharacterized protein (UPF0335 family)
MNERLKSFVDRIVRLEDEKKGLSDDIRDLYTQLKDLGYVPKVVRAIIRDERLDKSERELQETLKDLYRRELGLLADLPLGKAAMEKGA